ncbi:Protein CBG08677 [Caenorhabditis briggsae]|uniref:Protein CBG08677 n=1 Tax=Caenorhabditis briggsae TaxID=6238 RepID=A8X6U2_CAEBR|nr:Protein CBG08677 [Caenorhabditis briggsae]CAP28353.2 Protein CBG08677 [Caenorhabditis briggsae]
MYNQTQCQMMAEVATSSVLRSTLLVSLILCLLCIPINLYALWRIKISVKLHFNSKCVIFNHTFFVLVHILARIGLHGKDLINYFDDWESGCDIIPSRCRCNLRYLYKFSEYIIEVSPFILTIERFVATFQAYHYENRYKWFGILLNVFHLSLSCLFMFIQNSTNTGEVIIYYCWLAKSGNRFLVNVPTFFIFFSQLATIPGLLYLLRKNENFRKATSQKHSSLTERYQISENLRTSSMFRVMSVVTWAYVTYNAGGSYIAHYLMKSMDYAEQFSTIEIIHCVPIYYIILSIFIIRVDKKPRSEFIIKIKNYQNHYFFELQKFFDEAFEKITQRRHRVGSMHNIMNSQSEGKSSKTGGL